ncbi:zinc-binding alcohol dehydrogenase family protein [Terrimicrobium sacchariphilum]|uniref:Zinc-type alcohol dehydrogenase-like protein n=2 Tax=Terrimicrobium sacchariphilum TaxID=690879 RepID=A0A146G830_TERSA|nr:zinc-binding alcohol dehydrogenase family protein [Terrimicrobium sacchariphilum]
MALEVVRYFGRAILRPVIIQDSLRRSDIQRIISHMKAIVTTRPLAVEEVDSLIEIERPKPRASGRDLLVRVQAVAINPVDTKVRASVANTDGVILGWDAAGIVEEVGPEVKGFYRGDEVYYAGDITRPGSNAEYQLVDERIVARKPKTLCFADAAAYPLVTITAWEALYERLGIDRHGSDAGKSLLIIGGAGGVGSMAIQLARLAGLTVIATASRPASREWVLSLGANHVVNHGESLAGQLAKIGFPEVDFIANFNNTDSYWGVMAEVIKPLGKIVGIVETSSPVDLGLLKTKSATFSWEFMFTRSKLQTPDMDVQGKLLAETAGLIDVGRIKPIIGERLERISAITLRKAHQRAESGTLVGKLVIGGWQ